MMSHYAAMGYGISYGTLTGDLSEANYGSLRVGMLDERLHWKRLQRFIVVHVLDRVYRRWLKMALLNRMIVGITDFDAKRWTTVQWHPRGFDWIDPLKDVQGELVEVAAGVNTLTRMCGERGLDFEEIVEERAEELKLLEQYGVASTLATPFSDLPIDEDQDAADGSQNGSKPAKTADKGWSRARPVRPWRAAG
jgi:lambda family phage portal protein